MLYKKVSLEGKNATSLQYFITLIHLKTILYFNSFVDLAVHFLFPSEKQNKCSINSRPWRKETASHKSWKLVLNHILLNQGKIVSQKFVAPLKREQLTVLLG